jgi:Ran GTPase-activating protein 1
LSDNAFGGRSVDPMVPFIVENRSFQIFKLNNNGLGPEGGKVIANALLESAKRSKAEGKPSNLRTVICGRNRLEDGSAPTWAEAFAAHGTLLEVRMPQNGIRQDGMSALAEGLSKNPGLKYLDLQDNTFTADGSVEGIELWAKAMPSWPDIETINFSDCVLSTEGEVPAILTAIAGGSNPKLKSLLLQNNNLETESFSALSDAIDGHLRSLKSLELQWNDIEEDDVHLEKLRRALKARGGKLFVSDEDEEEEEEAEGTDEEEGTKAKTEHVKPAPIPAKDDKKTNSVDKAVDVLADRMGKVSLES